MGHVFDDRHWQILESEERKKILPVEPLLDLINKKVKKKDIAFDIGAGTGYFTVHLSKLFKKVYAVDISEKMCEILHSKIQSKNLKNVGIILSEKPPDVDFEIDFVLFVDSLHEIECRENYAEWCCKKAKTIAVVDWNKECKWGPPVEHRIDKEFVKELFNCFEFEEYNFYKCHFLLFGKID